MKSRMTLGAMALGLVATLASGGAVAVDDWTLRGMCEARKQNATMRYIKQIDRYRFSYEMKRRIADAARTPITAMDARVAKADLIEICSHAWGQVAHDGHHYLRVERRHPGR